MMWIAYRREEGHPSLTTSGHFVAINNSLFNEFEAWRKGNKDLWVNVTCIPVNRDTKDWLAYRKGKGLPCPELQTVYGTSFLLFPDEITRDQALYDVLSYCQSVHNA